MIKVVIAAAVALAIGLAVGFYLGRFTLERKWSSPFVTVSAKDENRASGGDPTPKAGARIFQVMPLGRARLAAKMVTQRDPLVAVVGSVGSGDEGSELHLALENRGTCRITAFEGVAYAYDAWGKPAKANKGGEHYVAFSAKGQDIPPGETTNFAQKLAHPETASLAVAHVDKIACADGPTWKRP